MFLEGVHIGVKYVLKIVCDVFLRLKYWLRTPQIEEETKTTLEITLSDFIVGTFEQTGKRYFLLRVSQKAMPSGSKAFVCFI